VTTHFAAHPTTGAAYVLGERPVWDAARQRLLWGALVEPGPKIHVDPRR